MLSRRARWLPSGPLAATSLLLAACASAPGRGAGPTSVRVVFGGDTAFGESYQEEYAQAGKGNVLVDKGYDWSLAGLDPLLASADLVITNLETPLDRRDSPFAGRKDYIHYADASRSAAALVRHRVAAVSLANNHAFDLGSEGLGATLDVLAAHGIAAFGAGHSEAEARRPFRHTLRVGSHELDLVVIAAMEARDDLEQDFGFYAYGDKPGVARLDEDAIIAAIRQARDSGRQQLVVIYPHWGANYAWHSEEQVRLARAFVAAGADLVIGHGAHMLGEVDRVDGQWVVFSVGNFMFNAAGRYEKKGVDPFSMAACLDLAEKNGQLALTLRLVPILSDNRATHYQPRPVTATEFPRVVELLRSHSGDPAAWDARFREGQDDIGPYLELDIDKGQK